MANILEGLQGLFGGLSQGLSGFADQRQQAMENEQKARAIAVQEAEQKRMEKGQIWTQRKAAYDALMGPQTEDVIRPLAAEGLPFIKNPDGTFSRPQSAEEQVRLKTIDPTFIGEKANLEYAPQAADNTLQRQNALALAATQGQNSLNVANVNNAGALQLAGVNNAADLQQTQMQTDASRYGADRMYQRVTDVAGMRPVDPKQYNEWKMMYLTNPAARQKYNATVAQVGPEQAEAWMVEAFKETFKGQVPQ